MGSYFLVWAYMAIRVKSNTSGRKSRQKGGRCKICLWSCASLGRRLKEWVKQNFGNVEHFKLGMMQEIQALHNDESDHDNALAEEYLDHLVSSKKDWKDQIWKIYDGSSKRSVDVRIFVMGIWYRAHRPFPLWFWIFIWIWARFFPRIPGIHVWWLSGIFKCSNSEMLLNSVISEFPVSFMPEFLPENSWIS